MQFSCTLCSGRFERVVLCPEILHTFGSCIAENKPSDVLYLGKDQFDGITSTETSSPNWLLAIIIMFGLLANMANNNRESNNLLIALNNRHGRHITVRKAMLLMLLS
jgi:hypothetical protein